MEVEQYVWEALLLATWTGCVSSQSAPPPATRGPHLCRLTVECIGQGALLLGTWRRALQSMHFTAKQERCRPSWLNVEVVGRAERPEGGAPWKEKLTFWQPFLARTWPPPSRERHGQGEAWKTLSASKTLRNSSGPRPRG